MVPSSSELISAISHPTRHRILRLFVDDADKSISAEDLAQVLEQSMAQVNYHLSTLARYEILRFSCAASRDGSGQGHYRWSLELEPEWLRVVLDIWIESRAAAG